MAVGTPATTVAEKKAKTTPRVGTTPVVDAIPVVAGKTTTTAACTRATTTLANKAAPAVGGSNSAGHCPQTWPQPAGEVAELLSDLQRALGTTNPGDYWVGGTWDLEGLREDAEIARVAQSGLRKEAPAQALVVAAPRRRIVGKRPPDEVATRALEPAAVKRRLNGKQASAPTQAAAPSPAAAATQGCQQVRRRLHGKQPPPLICFSVPPSIAAIVPPHYRTLGVKPSATASEIRQAYRLQALTHHPDKGGEREAFIAAHAAFMVLSDPKRRAAYDRELCLGAWSAKVSEEAGDPASCGPEAALVLIGRLLELPPEDWADRLVDIPIESLGSMLRFLRSTPNVGALLASKGAYKEIRGFFKEGLIGLYKAPAGYFVKLHWRTLNFRSLLTVRLDEAVMWHADLTRCKAKAEEGYQREVQTRSEKEALECAATEFEHFGHMLRYQSDIQKRSKHSHCRLVTPLYLDLRSAFEARRLLEMANALATNAEEQKARGAKKHLVDDITAIREAAGSRQQLLEVCIHHERRRQRHAAPTTTASQGKV